MTKLQLSYFQIHLLLSVMLMAGYIVFMVIDKDELEQKAQGYALKKANLLTLISAIAYVLYRTVLGEVNFTIHTILIFINSICILYLIFYYLYIKGIVISFKIKNVKALNALSYLSIGISTILIITQSFKVKFFEVSSSLFRVDTLFIMINFIVCSLIVGLYPKKKLSRDEYKKAEKTANKFSNIFTIVYGAFYIGLIGYIIYKLYTR